LALQSLKIKNETWFKIKNPDLLRPFLMNMVSDSNHWMFISSNGGVTAGRKNTEFALFPYYTDDKLEDLADTTGSKTIFQIQTENTPEIWEPFSERCRGLFKVNRNIFKNKYGNKVMLEEINHDLGLTFRYEWNSSNLFGFVKNSTLINSGNKKQEITVLDGIQNILPYGVDSELQIRSSNLVNAYKRSELINQSGLGIYALSAIIVDKAEPSEALKANVAWSFGLDNPSYLLSSLQLNRFRNCESIQQEEDIKAERGAYFLHSAIELPARSTKEWSIVANVNLDHSDVIQLNDKLANRQELSALVKRDVNRGTQNLIRLVAGADGLQQSSDELQDSRHFSNVLFNIMRGGTFNSNYQIEKKDFSRYLSKTNRCVYQRNSSFVSKLPEQFSRFDLTELLAGSEDPDLKRICKEYLPLKFSRRHGDPSRPWNQFSINTKDETDGTPILDYEGNWRDIFQNWEALALSYPGFLEGMIYKFLNASTPDGYNPYRVTKDGFDWETIDPDDPWSYIGYWGDHQIIYLLKFLEHYISYNASAFKKLLRDNGFVYANIPYRIKPYEELLKDPKNTIEFDEKSDKKIRQNIIEEGADAALLKNQDGNNYHVSFIEKILVSLLAKFTNFIPEAGIWMNTQRPEWNDANNALVGNGVSVVTLCYLRRFLKFFDPIIKESKTEQIPVSEEVIRLFNNVNSVLMEYSDLLNTTIDDEKRKKITDGLGQAGSNYRNKVYNRGFSGKKKSLEFSAISEFIEIALKYAEHTIRANRRSDDLYHSYNLISINEDKISVSRLDEMLEGQVAVLSSKYLSTDESVNVLNALRKSSLYRNDQQSYILYPDKKLPGFLDKNKIPGKLVQSSRLLKKLVSDGHQSIIKKDDRGNYHFNGNFKNNRDLKAALDELKNSEYASLEEKERELILQIFENVFNHKAFTGRSGTFFGYEGLGSIYWHMVSKLHVAVLEVCMEAYRQNTDNDILDRLSFHFDDIEKGIGVHKTPELYGAFPTDAYSHTPQHRGAQQPGMTGQVKEDILVRFGQLGVFVNDAKISFNPFLLKKEHFCQEPQTFEIITVDQESQKQELPADALGFTVCQVPVIYKISDNSGLTIDFADGTSELRNSLFLDEEISGQVFRRTGTVKRITVSLADDTIRITKPGNK